MVQTAFPARAVSIHKRVRARLSSLLHSGSRAPEPYLDPEPPAFATAKDAHDVPEIPDRKVFGPILEFSLSEEPVDLDNAVPTTAQAVVHLALLEAFWKLKQDATGGNLKILERVFGIDRPDSQEMAGVDAQEKEKEEEKGRDVVWQIFIEVAVDRFDQWWKSVGREIEKSVEISSSREPAKKLEKLPVHMLPPLDVLMIWHSYMLNPQFYYDDCRRLGFQSLLAIEFPWEAVYGAIDLDRLIYKHPKPAAEFFSGKTQQPVDLLAHLIGDKESSSSLMTSYEIICPGCRSKNSCAVAHWQDENFSVSCNCGQELTHDSLAANQLRDDIAALLSTGSNVRSCFSPPFQQHQHILTLLRASFTTAPTVSTHPTLASLRQALLASPPSSSTLPAARSQAIFTLFSFYPLRITPTSSACLSLTDAVLRQGSFVAKMHHHLWLRSPGIHDLDHGTGTLPRARSRYINFFRLFSAYPGETMVPTLDIDLFWHTHQLCPGAYYWYALQPDHAGRFIDHNDKLATGVLDDGFERTTRKYADRYGGDRYGGCFCWYCEEARNSGVPLSDDKVQNEGEEKKKKKVGKQMLDEEARREWVVRVKVEFWRQCEKRREEGGEKLGWSGLENMLKEG